MQAGLAAGEAVPPEFVDLVKPHVQSFDYFLGDGLTRVVELLEPIEVTLAPLWSACYYHQHLAAGVYL